MNKDFVNTAIEALRKGEIIVYPTDTLYALGADIYNEEAVKKVFRIKKRPFSKPFSVAIFDYNELKKISYTNDMVKQVVKNFLPGPLTLLLKKKKIVSNLITGGQDTIAVRIPKNNVALDLLSKFGPLTATSANIHGKKTPCVINELTMQFRNDVSVYLNDGRLDESPTTIVDLTTKKPYIIRQGAISINEIMNVI